MDEQGHVYTVDEALAHVGFGKYQCFVLAYAGLGWVAEAMEIMILSFVGPTVKSEWNLSSTEESLITTAVFTGLVVGAYAWGLVADNYGRRHAFSFALFIFVFPLFLSHTKYYNYSGCSEFLAFLEAVEMQSFFFFFFFHSSASLEVNLIFSTCWELCWSPSLLWLFELGTFSC